MNRLDIEAKHESSQVTLISKYGTMFLASRDKLSAASDFFAMLFNSEMKENKEGVVRLENIRDIVIRDFLEFINCGSVKITPTNAQDLIEAADYLFLTDMRLTALAGRFMAKRLSISNCISMYYYAEKYHCDELLVNAWWFILLNFTAVAESNDFRNLECWQVEQWISSDDIVVDTEDDVLKIIFMWIEENKSERKGKLEQLFRHVRLAFMSRDFLKTDVVTNRLIKENPDCLKLVTDAIIEGSMVFIQRRDFLVADPSYMEVIHCATSDNQPQLPRRWWKRDALEAQARNTLCYDLDKEKWYHLQNSPRDSQRFNKWSSPPELYVVEKTNRGILQSFLYCDIPLHNGWFKHDWSFSHNYFNQSWDVVFRPEPVVMGENKEREIYAVIAAECSLKTLVMQGEECMPKHNVESDSWEHVCSILCGGFTSVSRACAVAMNNYLYLIG